MADTVRTPRQQRSIDKKNKIIKAGFELFSEVGYYNVNTAEIAKRAGVSTGIVYGYFKDKRDILLDVLDLYIESIMQPVMDLLDLMHYPLDLDEIIPKVLDGVTATHEKYASIHQALYALTPTDSAVAEKFMKLERLMTDKFVEKLITLGYENDGLYERVHLAIETVQSYSHECVFDRHPYLNYAKMRLVCIKAVKSIMVA